MRLALMAALAAAPLMTGGAAQAASVEFKDAAARVVVIPEDRSDIKVEILKANPRLPLHVREVGGRTIVDGDLRRKFRGCSGVGLTGRVFFMGLPEVAVSDLPYVVVRAPRDVNINAGGAVFGSIGRAESVELSNAGCGDWSVADVRGSLIVRDLGSGDIRAGRAGEAEIRIHGSGDVSAREVAKGADIEIAGSGDVNVAGVGGRLKVNVAGSGDVNVGTGQVSAMDVAVMGSGDVNFAGSAQRLNAKIMGSGDVYAASVSGDINRSVMGSGKVRVGR